MRCAITLSFNPRFPDLSSKHYSHNTALSLSNPNRYFINANSSLISSIPNSNILSYDFVLLCVVNWTLMQTQTYVGMDEEGFTDGKWGNGGG